MRTDLAKIIGRRELFQSAGMGLGSVALGSLLGRGSTAAPIAPPRVATAKSVIFLHMVGAPSQLDLFSNKPLLRKYDGQKLPDHLWEGLRLAFIREQPNLLGSPFKFHKQGQSGLALSELLPHLGSVADELTMIQSMHSEQFNHAPAQLFMQTGFARFGRPCIGSWASYGLGSENEDLPAFVVMNTGLIAGAGNSLWGSGFLPTVHQGVEFRSKGDPVLFLSNPSGIDGERRGRIVDGINRLNQIQLADVGDPEIATRIDQYELAFRMQTSVPELMDTAQETASTHKLYGTKPGKPSFANNCLLARRLVERGVRFVQLYDQGWDTHGNVKAGVARKAKQVDQPIAALIKDLKQRGLLDQTLVVFASEFGRTPMLQGASGPAAGRDHHKEAFTIWMAGGGAKPATVVGETDDIGFNIVKDPVHVNDFHATLLHLLGINHDDLTYRYQGRDFRLTDVAGKVVTSAITSTDRVSKRAVGETA